MTVLSFQGICMNSRDFRKTTFGATNQGFGSRANRFDHCNTTAKQAKYPSPSSYITQPRTFSPEVARNKGWSVGLGRDVMLKHTIDRIQDEAKKKIASPSPTAYEKDPTFSKAGIHYSMRKRMHRYGSRVDKFDDYHYATEKKLPGPGYY